MKWHAERGDDWDRSAAIDAVESCRDLAESDPGLDDPERAVLGAVHDEAAKIGTCRLAVSTYRVEALTGIPRSTIYKTIIPRLIVLGWLVLVQRGDAGTRRANLYRVTSPEAATAPYPGLRPVEQLPYGAVADHIEQSAPETSDLTCPWGTVEPIECPWGPTVEPHTDPQPDAWSPATTACLTLSATASSARTRPSGAGCPTDRGCSDDGTQGAVAR